MKMDNVINFVEELFVTEYQKNVFFELDEFHGIIPSGTKR